MAATILISTGKCIRAFTGESFYRGSDSSYTIPTATPSISSQLCLFLMIVLVSGAPRRVSVRVGTLHGCPQCPAHGMCCAVTQLCRTQTSADLELVGTGITGFQLVMDKLDAEVARFTDTLQKCPEWGIHRCHRLAGLADAHWKRFELSGAIQDIEQAVTYQRQALGRCPVWNPQHVTFAGNLALMISDRFSQLGEVKDLEEVIQCNRKLLGLLHRTYSKRAIALNNLANSVLKRFQQTGDIKDIDEAIQLHHEALALCPAPHPDRASFLNNFATAVQERFQQRGDATDIDEAIQLRREVLALRPAPHPDRASFLNNFATAVQERFQQRGDAIDIDEAIQLHREALALFPAPHPGRAYSLSNLGSALHERFQQRGGATDIDEAIQLHREALALRPAPHPDRANSLNNLANTVHGRFEQRGDATDIDEAIQLHREALALRPAPHPERASSLHNLANAVYERFKQRGDATDIDEAIQLHREALALQPAPNPGRAPFLNNLANDVRERFWQRGDPTDIDEAIQLHREALALLPALHPDRAMSLNNLGIAVCERFQQRGDAIDINKAIQLHREALALYPAPHPGRASSLCNLGSALHERFRQRGGATDIDEAIQLHRESVALFPAPHPGRTSFLSNLASAVYERSTQGGDATDIDQAIQLSREALALWPATHPVRGRSLSNLGDYFMSLYNRTSQANCLSDAMLAFEEASADSSAPLLHRFTVAKRWASESHKNHHSSALDAYKTALGILPRLAALDLDIMSRQKILVVSRSHDLGSDAVACAIDLRQYNIALELLEAGRSVFWSQSLHLRTPLDDLRASNPLLATKLTDLSSKLEQSSFRDVSRNLQSDTHARVMSLEAEGLNCRRLNDEWVATVESIRSSVPGFQDFMQPKPIRRLRLAAEHGPVVALNAGEVRCHALILDPLGNVRCVDLPEITRPRVSTMTEIIRALASSSPSAFLAILDKRGDDLAAADRLLGRVVYEKDARPEDWFSGILMELWISVVKPVLDSLEIQKSDNPPRLWWCPTGPFTFLPIHAAGIYGDPSSDESVMNYVISSYTPTLTALISPPFPSFTADGPPRATVIIQPSTPGHSRLPYTQAELHKIEGQIPDKWLTKLGSTASLSTVLPHLQTSSIIHFACHGIQDTEMPLQSALIIGSERLTVAEIMKQSGFSHDGGGTTDKHMGLAFLSACETSTGDKNLPDEAMHLAATLLFAGFRSVVATMWTMHDSDGPEVADTFYGHLFRNAETKFNPPVFPNLSESAEALHLAVKELRTHVPFARWVPFVHYGL
ncbi:CHAT domain-containing protein [Mycena vulgaris]|nr:CHAT domain-containing protein [Mycena vulgaris]